MVKRVARKMEEIHD